jgi:hypothetical protein
MHDEQHSPQTGAQELGARLATWLEDLGLADQLAAAGLPTFERDLGGVARWRDPGTGEPLTTEQLADLDRVLHQDGDDPDHAVPLALVFAVHKAAERGGFLLVPHEGETLIPAFQLDDAGELRPELGAVLEPLLTAGMDPWQVWSWLTQPAGLLGGEVPHEAARDADEVAVVRHAAVRLAERTVR